MWSEKETKSWFVALTCSLLILPTTSSFFFIVDLFFYEEMFLLNAFLHVMMHHFFADFCKKPRQADVWQLLPSKERLLFKKKQPINKVFRPFFASLESTLIVFFASYASPRSVWDTIGGVNHFLAVVFARSCWDYL